MCGFCFAKAFSDHVQSMPHLNSSSYLHVQLHSSGRKKNDSRSRNIVVFVGVLQAKFNFTTLWRSAKFLVKCSRRGGGGLKRGCYMKHSMKNSKTAAGKCVNFWKALDHMRAREVNECMEGVWGQKSIFTFMSHSPWSTLCLSISNELFASFHKMRFLSPIHKFKCVSVFLIILLYKTLTTCYARKLGTVGGDERSYIEFLGKCIVLKILRLPRVQEMQ